MNLPLFFPSLRSSIVDPIEFNYLKEIHMTRSQKVTTFTIAAICTILISSILFMIHPALAFIYAVWLLFSHSLYQYLGHAKYVRSGLRFLNNVKTTAYVLRRTFLSR